jgi:predicted lactoylglutathione lyase
MTLNPSKCVNTIVSGLLLLKKDYPAITIKNDDIAEHMSAMFNGMGLKILNTIDSESLGAFIFYKNSFVLLIDKNGFANMIEISDEDAFEMLILFYSCRALTVVPKLYSKVIFEKNKLLNDIVQKIMLK